MADDMKRAVENMKFVQTFHAFHGHPPCGEGIVSGATMRALFSELSSVIAERDSLRSQLAQAQERVRVLREALEPIVECYKDQLVHAMGTVLEPDVIQVPPEYLRTAASVAGEIGK